VVVSQGSTATRTADDDDEPVAEVRGINVHAKQRVDGRDRAQIERLCRYITRPPLSQERLSRRADGRLELELKGWLARKDRAPAGVRSSHRVRSHNRLDPRVRLPFLVASKPRHLPSGPSAAASSASPDDFPIDFGADLYRRRDELQLHHRADRSQHGERQLHDVGLDAHHDRDRRHRPERAVLRKR
jgi:Putative transposase